MVDLINLGIDHVPEMTQLVVDVDIGYGIGRPV